MSINSQILKVSLSCGHPYQQWGASLELHPSLRRHSRHPRHQRYNPAVRGGARTIQVRILPLSYHAHVPYGPYKAYPPHSAPPNVPARTLGDACERGLAPWFTIGAVNTPVLQRMLESQPDRTESWLPPHLRGRMVPPPSLPMGAPQSPDDGNQQALTP